MELTYRQEKILNSLIKEYIGLAEPISSDLLKKRCDLNVSCATIRNEMQELTEQGYITQPHTSAGRVPTNKAYLYFIEVIFNNEQPFPPNFILKEMETAKEKIEKELKLAQELTKSLTEISTTLSYTRMEGKSLGTARDRNTVFEMLKIIGPSQATYDKNIDVISRLLEELENF